MEKIRNKFITLILFSIFLIIFVWIYKSFFVNNIDRNTYAILMNWKWTLNDELMIKDSKELLSVWDIVKTIWLDSLVVVEWWDWSVTRLWPNSSIKVNELYVEENLLQINLSFELLTWKSWSNVLNFLWSKSYFKESFRDIEAWVRWTVFNVDLDNNYINVIKHKVSLSWNDIKNTIIDENKPFSLKTFSFIKLQEFINGIKDANFENLNVKLDTQLFDWLKKQIHKDLDKLLIKANIDADNLSLTNKKDLYNELLSKYQSLNFITSKDQDLFSKKIEYKNALIKLATPEEKINLIENTIYDFKETIKSKNYWNIDEILPILFTNKNLLKDLNIDFWTYFENLELNEELKNIFWKNINYIKDIFWTDFSKIFPDITFKWIKAQTLNFYNDSIVKNKVEEQVGFIKKFLKLLFNK